MSDDAKRRKIKQLRALAESTTFPAEAASARAKADKLEAELPKSEPKPQQSPWLDGLALAQQQAQGQYIDPHQFGSFGDYMNARMDQYWQAQFDAMMGRRR
jgi:hypothetical protein